MKNSSVRKEGIAISIRDLFLYICSRWRAIIIVMICGALLLGGYGVYKNMSPTASRESIEVRGEQAKSRLTDSQIAIAVSDASIIYRYLEKYDFQVKYIENSVFQHLPPNNVKSTVITYYVDAENENALGIVSAYINSVVNEKFVKAVADHYEVSEEDAFYLYDKMVYASPVVNSNTQTLTTINNAIQTNSFTVNVLSPDDEYLETMTKLVKQSMADIYDEVEASAGKHKLVQVSEATYYRGDPYIFDTQNANTNIIKSITTILTNTKANISGDALTYTEYLVAEQYKGDCLDLVFEIGEEMESTTPGFSFRTINKKFVLLGAVMGAIAAALIILLKYLLQGALRCYDDIEYMYDIQVLGTIEDEKGRKKNHRTKLDTLIWKKRTKKKNGESGIETIVKKVEVLAKRLELDSICVLLGPETAESRTMIDTISEKANAAKVVVVDDILSSSDAVDKISECDAAIIVGKMDTSKFSVIDQRVQMLDNAKIDIIGAIVVE